jgi:hypothetical protein
MASVGASLGELGVCCSEPRCGKPAELSGTGARSSSTEGRVTAGEAAIALTSAKAVSATASAKIIRSGPRRVESAKRADIDGIMA